MVTALPDLIDKEDSFEIVGQQIAAILEINQQNQQALAVLAGEDPDLWKLQITSERSEPFEKWLNVEGDNSATIDESPIVNVWYETSTFPQAQGTVVERQASHSSYNIDIYAYGASQDLTAGGHLTGDEQAVINGKRAVRLVRNILMAAENTNLQAQGLVWQRWTQSITSFQPTLDNRPVQRVIGFRFVLAVVFNELSPQVEGEPLELVAAQLKRDPDGFVYLDADYEYPL